MMIADQLTIEKDPVVKKPKLQHIILLHGLFGNLSNWEYVHKELSQDNLVFVPKLPLHELSGGGLNALVDYLENYIVTSGLERVVLVGNSLGGHIALLYALKYPDKVEKLVLAGSSGLYENSFNRSFPRIKDYDYICARIKDTFYKKEVVTESLMKEVFDTIQNPLRALSILNLARTAQRHNLSDELHKITVPVLLIWGLQDQVTPPEVGQSFHEKLPDSELKYIDECGHVPMMEQPELFNNYLRTFLEK
jgi:2-hydroxy-6-oxonona-2,4-dienedioate hydrolase